MRRDVSIEERTDAIRKGVREALRESALLGHSVCVSRDGQIVWLTPAEILEELRRTAPESLNGSAQEPHD
jgi:hypothetical protein